MTIKIGLLGDIHCNTGWTIRMLGEFKRAKITRIYQLGDFGLWQGDKGQKFLFKVNRDLRRNGQKMYVTLGNHENYVLAQALQLIEIGEDAGWLWNPQYPNILFAPRVHRFEIEGVSFLSVGGANSIDREWRIEGESWWPEEQISYGDILQATNGGHAQVMLTHECPKAVNLFPNGSINSWSVDGLVYAEKSRIAMQHVVDEVRPELLFHGHYHFFADHKTTRFIDNKPAYDIRTVGLNRDTTLENIGILSLPDMKFELIQY
jgi:predicted phosphodiesterase